MTTVVVVDDQPLVRDGIRRILELAGHTVLAEASDGRTGIKETLLHRPDVVLMDVRMPGVDGIEATRSIVESEIGTRVLILTTFDLDEHVYEALRAGAIGYLLKDAGRQRIVAAVESAAAGESPLAGQVVARLVEHFVNSPPRAAGMGVPATEVLSGREREVLALIGRGRSNSEIADDLVISQATVKTHVRHILAKLELRDRIQAVVLAHELGLAGNPPGRSP